LPVQPITALWDYLETIITENKYVNALVEAVHTLMSLRRRIVLLVWPDFEEAASILTWSMTFSTWDASIEFSNRLRHEIWGGGCIPM
jgi:hypothetical protein